MENDVPHGTRALESILRTKLHRPQLGAVLVRRDRLLELMQKADEVPLTLVLSMVSFFL